MPLNPNIPYPIYDNGKYVSLFSTSNATTHLIKSSDYFAVEAKYNHLSASARDALARMFGNAPAKYGRELSAERPQAEVSPGIAAELSRSGLGSVDMRSVFSLDREDRKSVV